MEALVSYKDEDEEHLTSSGDSQERVHAEQSVSNTTHKRPYNVNGLEGVDDSAFVNDCIQKRKSVASNDGGADKILSAEAVSSAPASVAKSPSSFQHLGAIIRKPPHRPDSLRRRSPSAATRKDTPRQDLIQEGTSPATLTPDTVPFSANERLPSTGTSIDNEAVRLRHALRPPPIDGVEDWGMPSVSDSDNCDPVLVAQLAEFARMKRGTPGEDGQPAQPPKHFNDSLMGSRAFRNPHLYARLVDFVDVDETISNFPTSVWDPHDVPVEWFAESIAEQQKCAEEKRAAAQAGGKRSRIDFAPPSSSSNSHRAGNLGGGTLGRGRGGHGAAGNRYLAVSRNGVGAGRDRGSNTRWG